MSRSVVVVALLVLLPVAVCAQFGSTPAASAPDFAALTPCMVVDGMSLSPVALIGDVSSLSNAPTLMLDGVAMALIGAAAKSGGGEAAIVKTDAGSVLEISKAGASARFAVLSAGNFWLHPDVRALLSVNIRQPVPRWPHVDANFPSRAPFGVNWKRPYLDWKPDEAWLRAMLAPPVVVEEEIIVEEEAEEVADVEETEEAAAAPDASPDAPGDMMGGDPGAPGDMMGGGSGAPDPGMMMGDEGAPPA